MILVEAVVVYIRKVSNSGTGVARFDPFVRGEDDFEKQYF